MSNPNKPLRVLYLSSVPFIGGGELSLITMVKALDSEKVQAVFAVPGEGEWAQRIRKAGFPVISLDVPSPNTHRQAKPFRTIQNIIQIVKQEKIQLLHNNSMPYLTHAVVAAGWQRIPLVCHVRDTIPDDWFTFRHRLIAKRVNRFMCISKAVQASFGNGLNTTILYNGIDAQAFSPRDDKLRDEFHLGDAPLIGMAGYLIERKGHASFLQAAAQVLEQLPAARFIIFGKDPMPGTPIFNALHAQVKELGIPDKVIFTGFRDDLPNVMADLDVLAMPSWNEPFGRVLVEGFAAQVPVIGTNAGGAVEIIDDGVNGLLVPPKDHQALATAMLRVLQDNSLRESLCSAGQKTLQERFSPDSCATAMQDVYQEILS